MSDRLAASAPRPDWFWRRIEETLKTVDEPDARCEALREALAPLSSDELFAFDCDYRRRIHECYRWDLWAAAYILNGGASDDGFDYFRDWLISRGRTVYEAARRDPESLIGTGTPYEAENEEFRYVVQEVHEAKFNIELPWSDLTQSINPMGEAWKEEEVYAKFPKLSAWVNANG